VANVLEIRAGGLTLSALRRIHEQPIVLQLSGARPRPHCRRQFFLGGSRSSAPATPHTASIRASAFCADPHTDRAVSSWLQRNLLLSHAAGVGDALPDPVVADPRTEDHALARGHSGITMAVIDALLARSSMKSIR